MMAEPLESYTKSASPPRDSESYSCSFSDAERKEFGALQRVRRYALLAVARRILSDQKENKKGLLVSKWRVAICRRILVFGKDYVEIRVNRDLQKAWFGNLAICGSVHTCAVDAYTIGHKRALELREGIEKKQCGQGFMVVTVQHSKVSDCKYLYDLVAAGTSYMLSGSPIKKFYAKWKIKGVVSGWDYTCSIENGHHPHKNVLFISEVDNLDCEEFRSDCERIAERYKKYISSKGLVVNSHTTKVLSDKKDCAEYMTKWALSLEVAETSRKEGSEGHFTQFQLLYEIGFKELDPLVKAKYINLFREFAVGSKGRRQMVYSKGLRDWLGLGEEKTDEELAEEGTNPYDVFARLMVTDYQIIFREEFKGSLAKLLEVARKCDEDIFWDYVLDQYEITRR